MGRGGSPEGPAQPPCPPLSPPSTLGSQCSRGSMAGVTWEPRHNSHPIRSRPGENSSGGPSAGLAQSRWRACAGMTWRPEHQPTHFKVTEPSLILAFGNHCRSFRVAQRVKDFTWSLLRFRSQLWRGCEPWARSSRQSQREVEGNHFELVRSLGGALCREGAQTHMHHQPPRSFSGGLSPPATRTCPRVRSSALCSLM